MTEAFEAASFIALDVECANNNPASICQIGIVLFEAGIAVRSIDMPIKPECAFGWYHSKLHGITAKKVADAPTYPEIHEQIVELLSGKLVVTHSKFDRSAFLHTTRRYGLPEISCRWLDATVIIRHTWDDLRKGGYGLAAMAKRLDIEFDHHNAVEDARVTGLILVEAFRVSQRSLEGWEKKFNGGRFVP